MMLRFWDAAMLQTHTRHGSQAADLQCTMAWLGMACWVPLPSRRSTKHSGPAAFRGSRARGQETRAAQGDRHLMQEGPEEACKRNYHYGSGWTSSIGAVGQGSGQRRSGTVQRHGGTARLESWPL